MNYKTIMNTDAKTKKQLSKQKPHSPKFLKKRKFLMVLPLLVLPFTTIIFVSLGGGKGNGAQKETNHGQIGLNTKLPDAHFKKGREKDKLGLYEQAGKDSAKLREEIKNDPYYRLENHAAEEDSAYKMGDLQAILQQSASKHNQTSFSKLKTSVGVEDKDSNEEKVLSRLALLKKELDKKPSVSPQSSSNNISAGHEPDPEVEKLEDMIKVINTKNETDPELKQLSGMLDKILLVQHPEKLQDSIKPSSAKKNAEIFSVSSETADQNIFSLDNTNTINLETQNGFYDLGQESSNGAVLSNGIEAVIEETQTVVSGSTVKLRLLSDININDLHIPKGQFVYGTASLNNERLRITISSIRYQNSILPVSMDAYDMDGLAGIYVPGSISRDVTKQSADEAISSIGLTSLDPSVGAQAASAGIQAAKTLLGKKIKLTRVSVKAGYRVLLKDNKQK